MLKSIKLLVIITFLNCSAFCQVNIAISEIMYNPPESGTDSLEFLEIYNYGVVPISLSGFNFSSGINYQFQEISIPQNTYLVIAKDSIKFQKAFNISALQWSSGSLLNTGEAIVLRDDNDQIIDSVFYRNTTAWGKEANGNGASLVLCDPFSNHSLPENWTVSSTSTDLEIDSVQVFASPNKKDVACTNTDIIEGNSVKEAKVYPNPSSGMVSFTESLYNMKIYAPNGDLFLYQSQLEKGEELNLVQSGIYFGIATNKTGDFLSFRILIIK